ncbi:MAG: Hpt domain-containing protein [Spirochaetia bacterium]|nr:Hpt domain-containing protein [Spirochaetia bacterium]
MSDSIRVKIDSGLADLIPGYLERVKGYCQDMRSHAASADWDFVRVTGHNLKGSGGGYGFDEISVIGAKLEAAAKASDAGAVETELGTLDSYLSRVVVEFS